MVQPVSRQMSNRRKSTGIWNSRVNRFYRWNEEMAHLRWVSRISILKIWPAWPHSSYQSVSKLLKTGNWKITWFEHHATHLHFYSLEWKCEKRVIFYGRVFLVGRYNFCLCVFRRWGHTCEKKCVLLTLGAKNCLRTWKSWGETFEKIGPMGPSYCI